MRKWKEVKKVVIEYQGGIEKQIIMKWIKKEMGEEVVKFKDDIGKGEEIEKERKKEEMMGIKEILIEEVREELVRDLVLKMLRENEVYEGVYMIGKQIERKMI